MEVTLEAGELDKRILIQIDDAADNTTLSGHTPNWVPWPAVTDGLVWAGFRGLNGREAIKADQLQVTATQMITMRWIPGLTAVKMRAVYADRIFDFGYVLNVNEANVRAEIMACERIA